MLTSNFENTNDSLGPMLEHTQVNIFEDDNTFNDPGDSGDRSHSRVDALLHEIMSDDDENISREAH